MVWREGGGEGGHKGDEGGREEGREGGREGERYLENAIVQRLGETMHALEGLFPGVGAG